MSRPIKCPVCGYLFAVEGDDAVLNMKVKEVFRHIRGGEVWGPCRRCGAEVRWPEARSNGR
jgi:hypothetical protein